MIKKRLTKTRLNVGDVIRNWTVKEIHGDPYDLATRVTAACRCGKDDGDSILTVKTVLYHAAAASCRACRPTRNKYGIPSAVIYSLNKRWYMMMQRCYNKKDPRYARYGGRGITVAKEFHECIEYCNFVYNMPGFDLGLTVDRADNDGNYCRENLRLVTQKTQARNVERNITIEYQGQRMSLVEFVEKYCSIGYEYARLLYHKGVTPEQLAAREGARGRLNYSRFQVEFEGRTYPTFEQFTRECCKIGLRDAQDLQRQGATLEEIATATPRR